MEPLLEKYRPKVFGDIVGHDHIITSLQEMLTNIYEFPHVLFHGAQGTGKTTMMEALAREIYKDAGDWEDIVLAINASEERNLDTVRNKIMKYCKTASTFYDVPRKMVILEEADHFNILSQPALRRPMETFSRTTIFGLTCNYTRKIIPPLRSRCAMYRFVAATPEHIKTFITRVAGKEDISIEGDALELIALNAYGDFRTGLMAMQMATQRTTEGSRHLTAERLIELLNYITQESIDEIMRLTQESKTVEAVELADSYLASGVLPEMMLDAFYKYCRNKGIFQREEVGVQAIKLFVDTSKDISTSIIPAIAIDYLLMSLGKLL